MHLFNLLLPLILTAQSRDLSIVGMGVGLWSVGSLAAALLSTHLVHVVKLRSGIIWSLVLCGLFSWICLFDIPVLLLLVIRFLQGLASGTLRPFYQVWLIHQTDVQHFAQKSTSRATYNQVALAAGMVVASAVAALVAPTALTFETISALILAPTILALLAFVLSDRKSDREAGLSSPVPRASEGQSPSAGTRETLHWLKSRPLVVFAFLQFVLSMAAFKLWLIGIPLSSGLSGLRQEVIPGATWLSLLFTVQNGCGMVEVVLKP